MRKLSTMFWSLLFVMALLIPAGCGSGTGSEGDKNDPAETTDVEQMQDETDPDVANGGATNGE